ncbi:MAG: leucine-rich repeat protein [Methanomassiliicoccaceae archaeon]|nr:leucine-rich repeat protein [Methanomassiliicoccaceae archaeon]
MKIDKILMVLLSLVIVTVSAVALEDSNHSEGAIITIYDGNFQYSYDDSGSLDWYGLGVKEVTLVKYLADADTVVIPNTITYGSEQYLVTVIGYEAFYQKSVKNLTMGENVRFIDDAAFMECKNIERLDLKGVTTIGNYAFTHCTSLTDLNGDSIVTIGDYAFALWDRYMGNPYPGPGDTIPYIDTLYLPNVKTIGTGAFGTVSLTSTARDFGTVRLPSVETIGDYAFSQSKIDDSLYITSAVTVGRYAFFYDMLPGNDDSPGYSISLTNVTGIGDYAFTGRAITTVALSSTNPYTIGKGAFESTDLLYANLGMVSSIGQAAFEGTKDLAYFRVDPLNPNYASLISGDTSAAHRGEPGALYELAGGVGSAPTKLVRLPPGIKPLLSDMGNKFTVANGVTSMEDSAFYGCPSITVDLNEIEYIPAAEFAGSYVTNVIAHNVTLIDDYAFNGCTLLSSFEFLETGGSLEIGRGAFLGTGLGEIRLPKDTKVGIQAFSNIKVDVGVVEIWGDTVLENNSFAGTTIKALMVSSDATCADKAKIIFDNWNASGWIVAGSNPTSLLMINNIGNVDISGLTPTTGGRMIQLMHSVDTLTYGGLQFVENKDLKTPPFHMISVKAGIYGAETHPSFDIKTDVSGTTSFSPAKTGAAGDGKTWELRQEYYEIVYYSFPCDTDNGFGTPIGEDPDYVNPLILTSTLVSDREEIGRDSYLSGTPLKSMQWPTFVRYGLKGWYVADDPAADPSYPAATIYTDESYRVTANSAFGTPTIPDAWIVRDPVTDQGTLNVFAIFVGKEYNITIEARLTSGQDQVIDDSKPNTTGGTVELYLDAPMAAMEFSTNQPDDPLVPGLASENYAYGTHIYLKAVPKPGYAFVGWMVVDMEDDTTPMPLFTTKDDRSLVQSQGAAYWDFDLPLHLKYVAFFAKVVPVTFDNNSAAGTTSPIYFVVGDKLVEDDNDYNGHDYEAIFGGAADTDKGTSYYPGTPTVAGLTFGGWYSGTTLYAGYNEGTNSLTDLLKIPNVTSLALKAKWYATITFYANDGINNATLTAPTGVILANPSPEVYVLSNFDVGNYSAGGYSAVFNYGTGLYSPTPTFNDVNFNGWYVLDGGTTISDIKLLTSPDTNNSSPYMDLYPTYARFEPGTAVNGNMSLIALYSAKVEFFFNINTLTDHIEIAPGNDVVNVPVSVPVTFGSSNFNTIHAAMASPLTFKLDTIGTNMEFMGWYDSSDGVTLPTMAETPLDLTDYITENIRLIAGWGVDVTFDDGGESILDVTNSYATWVPSSYGFTVLEGTVFLLDGTGMPDIVHDPSMDSPSAWYDADAVPYVWYMHNVSTYTYSVTLTPGFSPLFEFNMMGGTPAAAYVQFTPGDTFGDVLTLFLNSIYVTSTHEYLELTKAGGSLHYKNDGSSWSPGDAPNAVWYKDDGNPLRASGTPLDYVNNPESGFVQWTSTMVITSSSDAFAYIRWMADVDFDLDIPPGDVDSGTTSPPPAPIKDIDEGTPFASLGSMTVPIYNSSNDKTFKGWYNGVTMYTGQNGAPLTGAPNITGNITLTAQWGVEVKFYYTGAIIPASIPAGAEQGTDGIGSYVILDVVGGHVTPPSLAHGLNFGDNHLLWYENGFSGSVPILIPSFVPSDPGQQCFDTAQVITKNKVLYARWYAEVNFNATGGSSFFTSTLLMLEGSKVSDLTASPYNVDLQPYDLLSDPSKTGWEFIGWFDRSAATGYDDLGKQYYQTDFDFLPYDGITPTNVDASSLIIKEDVTLDYEYVVKVDFNSNYDPGVFVPYQYLRVNMPLPDSTSDRFTDKPARAGVTFMGWYDLTTGVKYTLNRDSAEPNSEIVYKPMTLTAAWLVTVDFYDLGQYRTDGLQVAADGVNIVHVDPDGTPWNDDDYFEMPEGTSIRQFITTDPSPTGKTFVSWFVELGMPNGLYEAGDIMYGLNDKIYSSITLTAGYGFIMSFDTNGGIPASIPDVLVIEGQSFDLPAAPAKGRLTFTGWEDDTSAKVVRGAGDTVPAAAITSDMVFKAKWLVRATLYDGISMTPILTMEWDEEDGPNFTYSVTTDSDYNDGIQDRIITVQITYTSPTGVVTSVTMEKFIDRYDFSIRDWVKYYSVFAGWFDPFTGATLDPNDPLQDMFLNSDSMALFAKWDERIRFYDADGSTLNTVSYVETGDYLGNIAPYGGMWADTFSPTTPLNPDTYRIRDSADFVPVKFITVTFDANGGTPATQIFDAVSGTMLGAVGAAEPTRTGMFFAGWYDGTTKYAFSDKLTDNITLKAKWQSTPVERYTIFAFASDNANIIPQGMIKVMSGDTVSFDFYAARGYNAILKIDGMEVYNTTGSYTFRNVTADHSIEVVADNRDIREATKFLTVNISGKGDVLYSNNGGTSFVSYTEPLPLFHDSEYILRAVPKGSSYFTHWSGDASGSEPQITIQSDGLTNMSVTANFGSTTGFGTGSMGIANLICMIVSIAVGVIALAVAQKRNYEGTGTGKALRFGALFVALIAVALFFLTEGFGGSYVPWDEWSPVMVALALITVVMALVSVRYDYSRE